MQVFYKDGFYIKGVSLNIPIDAVEITEETYKSLLKEISNGKIIPKSDWQEYNGIITFGDTYDNQGIYIGYEGNFCGGNLYIKDLSLKIYENNNKTDFTKKSQIITGELSELDSNKTYVYKNSKITTNEIIEI